MNPEQFVQELAKHNLQLNKVQEAQFKLYFKTLVIANEHVNLTRITAKADVYLKHFFDSLTPLFTFETIFKKATNLCDVGAGAGFPSIPLKILLPDLKITIIDSLGKRLTFLEELIAKLQLSEVTLVHGRAEDIGQNPIYREKFSLVTARAVANMSTLSEYCLPLVKPNDYFIALKGPKAEAELKNSQKAISILGAEKVTVKEISLPAQGANRTLILLKKVKNTPQKYPRQAGTPNRKPIH